MRLDRFVVRLFEVLVHRRLVHPEGTPYANSRKLTGVDQAVHGHLGDSHNVCNFSDRQKRSVFCMAHTQFSTFRHAALQASPPAG